MKFLVYRDTADEFRWRLVAKNGETVADSGEGYKRISKCTGMISKIITSFVKETPVIEVEPSAKPKSLLRVNREGKTVGV